MPELYPEIEPYESGMLDVGDGNAVYWETCGSPDGKPPVYLHGGPGSGCTAASRPCSASPPAATATCRWESATPLEDGALLGSAGALADIPGILVNGRFDFQAPLANAWKLREVWPRAELVVVEDAGHAGSAVLDGAIVGATDGFA